MMEDEPENFQGIEPRKQGWEQAILAWILTAFACAGLLSFLFWQPSISKAMAAYYEVAATPNYEIPQDVEPATIALGLLVTEADADRSMTRAVTTHTEVEGSLRTTAIDYTVESGDSIFGIAKKFDVSPETILWANYDVLSDNPHELREAQVLRIPPTTGIWYKWSSRDTLNRVAEEFRVEPKDILLYVGNELDLSDPKIESGKWIMIPGGQREFVQFVIPTIPRGFAGVNQSGYNCGKDTSSGAIGGGYFIWPADNHYLSGNDYWSGHLAVDIAAGEGAAVYAADSGVVVWAGPVGGGYGNMIMIDHGNGFATLYAHLSGIYVGCGQSVSQGTRIGSSGSTGNSTGAHLHFEIRYLGGWVSPWSYLP